MDSTPRVVTPTTTDLPVTLPSRFLRDWTRRSPRRSCVQVSPIDCLPRLGLTSSHLQGVTVFSPLSHYGAGPGKRVGIIGIGGLGHLGIQFSKALGAETFALSTSKSKEADCKAMGADGVLVTKDPKALLQDYAGTFDLLIGTSFAADMPFDTLFLPLLKPRGHIVQVGLPEERLPGIKPQAILGKSITGSLIGSPAEIKQMFDIAVKHNVKPWIQERPMSDAQQAVQGGFLNTKALRFTDAFFSDMHEGKARYRYVLVNDQ